MKSMRLQSIEDDMLSGTENQLRLSIHRLLNPPRGRVLTVDQWWAKCMEIDNQILIAIKDGRIPNSLRISKYVQNKVDYFLNGIVTRADYVRQFQAVSDYLAEQENKPEDVRYKEYTEMIEQ